MPQTSDTSDGAKPLKTDRRIGLDGGLDTRAGPLTIGSDKATALGNFRFGKQGCLQKRMGGLQLCTVPSYSATSFMPAPILEDAGATGALAAGTYTIGYILGTVSLSGGKVGIRSAVAAITVAVNHAILITVPGINNGEGLGKLVSMTFLDDPANAGFLFSGVDIGIYAKIAADPNQTLQVTGASFPGITLAGTIYGRSFVLNAYTNTGTIAVVNQVTRVPVRKLFWHPLIDTLIGLVAETPFALQGGLTAPQFLVSANDSAGNAFFFSRLPTRVSSTVVDRCLIFSDAVGRPKILNTPADITATGNPYGLKDPTFWSFRQLGAAAPAAAPTVGAKVAGALTGTYQYVSTLVYRRERQDGTFFDSESNASPILTTTYAAQQAPISVAVALESGARSWNLYRTVAGGTDFFLLASRAFPTVSFTDNTPDTFFPTGNLFAGQRPPDKSSDRAPNDVPPQMLALVTEHAGRGFGCQCDIIRAGTGAFVPGQMIRPRISNVIMYSQVRFPNDIILALTANVAAAPGDFGNIDAWPSTFQFPCGDTSPITNLVSFRGVLYVFKEDEIGVVEGSTDKEFAYRTIWSGTGAMENSIIIVGNYILAFDQALGPILVSGYSIQDLGYQTIQQDWIQPITVSAGEAVSGGGRSAAGVISAKWDPVNAEARWVISDYQTDPNSGTATGTTPKFFEYVCQLAQGKPTEQFTRFTGAVSGTTVDRRILTQDAAIVGAAAAPFRARDIVFGDYQGRVVRDQNVEFDLDGVIGSTAISIRATFPFFFGESPEIVKLFRYLYAMVITGTNIADAMVFAIQSLAKDSTASVTVATVNGSALSGINQQKRIPLPASLDGTNNMDRGVRVVVSGSAQSGPTALEELALKYQDVSERSKP